MDGHVTFEIKRAFAMASFWRNDMGSVRIGRTEIVSLINKAITLAHEQNGKTNAAWIALMILLHQRFRSSPILWYVRVKYPFPHKGSTVWWLRGTILSDEDIRRVRLALRRCR